MPKFTQARKQGLLVYVAKAVEEILKDTNAWFVWYVKLIRVHFIQQAEGN